MHTPETHQTHQIQQIHQIPNSASQPTTKLLRALAVAALVFGLLTIFSGGQALFGSAQAQAAVGNVVPLVLWFNFFAGFAYVLVAWGLWEGLAWVRWGALALAGATSVVAIAFALQVQAGVPFEMRTVGALIIRVGFWVVVSGLVWRRIKA